jgi:hypothetical protein
MKVNEEFIYFTRKNETRHVHFHGYPTAYKPEDVKITRRV